MSYVSRQAALEEGNIRVVLARTVPGRRIEPSDFGLRLRTIVRKTLEERWYLNADILVGRRGYEGRATSGVGVCFFEFSIADYSTGKLRAYSGTR